MGMFDKKDDVKEELQKAESEVISSIIDKSMVISGEISFKGKTKIDGTVKGNVSGEHLILSESGKITGDIVASSFNCFGSLNGNVKANIIIARKNCTIRGKLLASSLTVEPGATVDGEIKAAVKTPVQDKGHNVAPIKAVPAEASPPKK